jgi:hypothetical protein
MTRGKVIWEILRTFTRHKDRKSGIPNILWDRPLEERDRHNHLGRMVYGKIFNTIWRKWDSGAITHLWPWIHHFV